MRALIKWLREVEQLSSEVYSQAATAYAKDPHFRKFLEHTAEDEAWHYHVMGSAEALMLSEPNFAPAISIDDDTNNRIKNCFQDIKSGLDSHTISKDEVLEKIVEAELSEWNDIFLYVVNTLTAIASEFKYPAARMQAHIKGISHYIEKVENRSDILEGFNELKPVWVESILIVDDNDMVSILIKDILNRDGDIDIAENGKEALELVDKKFYKLIISDVDMPKMNGIAFFEKAIAKYPTIKSRFLFITGDLSCARNNFFNDHQVKCLEKPMGINALREEAYKIILAK